MINLCNKPVFIHSMFRSGSTYLYEVFRRHKEEYWCYYEPLHEEIKFLKNTDIEKSQKINLTLHHPILDKPYFDEFLKIGVDLNLVFKKRFSYDCFFLEKNQDDPELKHYIQLLLDHASKRPLLQFCRSTGRIPWLKSNFKAIHIFLLRNPWDQWFSYKITPYFDHANRLIFCASSVPLVINDLRKNIRIICRHTQDISDDFRFCASTHTSPEISYTIFFALWCYTFIQGSHHADCVIDMDLLGSSFDYQEQISTSLSKYSISGLNFNDCHTPQNHYSIPEVGFFNKIEDEIIKHFKKYDYETNDINAVEAYLQSRRNYVQKIQYNQEQAKTTIEQLRVTLLNWQVDFSEINKQLNNAIERAEKAEYEFLLLRNEIDRLKQSYLFRFYRVIWRKFNILLAYYKLH